MIAFVALAVLLAATCDAAGPAQTQDPTRPLRLEIGLFTTDELVNDFEKTKLLSGLGKTQEIFKATLLSNYIYGLHETFSDKSIGNLNIQVVITHFEVVPASTWRTWRDLGAFCRYESAKQDLGIDAAILIVSRGGILANQIRLGFSAGRSFTDTLGSSINCGAVTEDATLGTAYKRLISHELGHIIGLIDQGGKLLGKLRRSSSAMSKAAQRIYPYNDMRCKSASVKAIMAGSGDTWSECSKDRLKLIMGSDKSKVAEHVKKPALLPDTKSFVGDFKAYTRQSLCETMKDNQDAAGTKIMYKKVDSGSECKFRKGECGKTTPLANMGGRVMYRFYDDASLPTGSKCLTGYCFFGDCLSGNQLSAKMAAYTKPIVN